MGLFSKAEVIILKETSDADTYLKKLEELLPRANKDIKQKIQKEIAITKAGIVGEENILFELKNSNMDMVVLSLGVNIEARSFVYMGQINWMAMGVLEFLLQIINSSMLREK